MLQRCCGFVKWDGSALFFQREDELQSAAFAVAGGDGAAVDHHGVLDDRQPQPRAALLARTALVDAVEALEDVRQMLLPDADALVGADDRALLGGVVRETDEDCLLYTSDAADE